MYEKKIIGYILSVLVRSSSYINHEHHNNICAACNDNSKDKIKQQHKSVGLN